MISADKKHQKDSKKKVVIAIGGNAILQKNQIGTFKEQQENTQKTAKGIVSIVLENICTKFQLLLMVMDHR